jgi:hypothetical protein
MSPSEYQELVEFLTGQFGQIDRRFHHLTLEIDRRFTLLDGRLTAFQAEVGERFREVFGHFDEIYDGWSGWSRSTTRSRSSCAGSRRR